MLPIEPAAEIAFGSYLIRRFAVAEDVTVKLFRAEARLQQRQKRLEDGARKEGAFKLYGISAATLLSAYTAAFMKKYPFIKGTYYRAGGDPLLQRILTEARGGKHLFDVVTALGGGKRASVSVTGNDALTQTAFSYGGISSSIVFT